MSQPQMPNIPGAAVMTDTLDFVKSLWGSMSVPGLTAPTLSVEELDKKINDLKAVETWLNLNMSMLRGSIQALEVQRGTIATLKSVGASLAAAVQQGGAGAAAEKSMFDANPYASAFFQQTAARADKPARTQAAAPAPTPAPASAPAAAQAGAGDGANPALWWNLLQDQFKQAVTAALSPDAKFAAAGAKPAGEPATGTPSARAGAASGGGTGNTGSAGGKGNTGAASGTGGTGSTGGAAAKAAPRRKPAA